MPVNLNLLLAPIISILILIFGQGAYTTLTTIRLVELQAHQWEVGMISSAFFLGLLVGSYWVQHFILRVRHIRAFAAFAAVAAACAILQGLYYDFWFWLVMRFLAGYSLAGLFVVTESWLLGYSTPVNRGRTLAIYMATYYFAQASGQILLGLPYEFSLIPFVLIALCAMLSIIPVTVTRFEAPTPESPTVTSVAEVFKRAPLGVIGNVCAGMILAVVYTLLPSFYAETGNADTQISYLMMGIILGGMLLQYPLGKLSDIMDKRKVLIGLCCATIVMSGMIIVTYQHFGWLLLFTVLLGGSTFTFYTVNISYSIDFVEPSAIVSALSALLLAYGVGTAIGPLLVSPVVYVLGQFGYFIYFMVIAAAFGVCCIRQFRRHRYACIEEDNPYVAMPGTSPEVMQLDPRGEEAEQLALDFELEEAPNESG